jgi:hypothetical protein
MVFLRERTRPLLSTKDGFATKDILNHHLARSRAINTMEEPNGQEWEIEQEGTPEQKDKEIDESRREEAA